MGFQDSFGSHDDEITSLQEKRRYCFDEIYKIHNYIIEASRKGNSMAADRAADRKFQLLSQLKSLDEQLVRLSGGEIEPEYYGEDAYEFIINQKETE